MFPHPVRGYLHFPTLSCLGGSILLYKTGKLWFCPLFMAKKKTASKTRVVKIVPVVERIEAKRAEIAGLSADRNMVSAKIKQASDELAALNVEERGV